MEQTQLSFNRAMIRFNRSKIIYPCTRNHFLSVLKLRFFLSTILQIVPLFSDGQVETRSKKINFLGGR